jgi:hypothetical protein
MNVSKTLISTAVAMSVAGVVGFAFAQSNPENINIRYPNNLTQTQSDAALPCQPGPFNPHLPADQRSRATSISDTSSNCETVITKVVQVQAPAPVIVQMEAAPSFQPAPAAQPVEIVAVAQSAPVDNSPPFIERDARADRN